MKNTTTLLLVVGVALVAVIVTRTPAQQEGRLYTDPDGRTWYDHPDYENEVTPAREATGVGAAGGTCPSDVNNDGVVGIQDFLQVLGAWGPCPAPTVVAMDSHKFEGGGCTPIVVVRQWSDGLLECVDPLASVAQTSSHVGTPVEVSLTWLHGLMPCASGLCDGQGFTTGCGLYHVFRQYADGFIESATLAICRDNNSGTYCAAWGQWAPFPGLEVNR